MSAFFNAAFHKFVIFFISPKFNHNISQESHQKTKADTSGTAKAVIESLKTISNDSTFSIDNDIDMLRDDTDSLDFGVPKEGLNGHAFHVSFGVFNKYAH